jgi:hypothetical protein
MDLIILDCPPVSLRTASRPNLLSGLSRGQTDSETNAVSQRGDGGGCRAQAVLLESTHGCLKAEGCFGSTEATLTVTAAPLDFK